jgi:hypothetical protein
MPGVLTRFKPLREQLMHQVLPVLWIRHLVPLSLPGYNVAGLAGARNFSAKIG